MNIHEKNQIIFNEAKQYLEQNANPKKYQHYFEEPEVHSLNEAFEVAVRSVRDITVISEVIKYNMYYPIIKECLFDFDYNKVLSEYGNGKDDRCNILYRSFRDKIRSDGKDNKNNSWYKFARNICEIADYISRFDCVEDMISFFARPQNDDERIQLANKIADTVFLWKFKMVCNWLKDIGVKGFAKPDSVLSFIFTELCLADKNDESIFKAVNLMAQDTGASVFLVDRLFWLIGTSASDVIKEIERKKGKNKEDFVKTVSSKI